MKQRTYDILACVNRYYNNKLALSEKIRKYLACEFNTDIETITDNDILTVLKETANDYFKSCNDIDNFFKVFISIHLNDTEKISKSLNKLIKLEEKTIMNTKRKQEILDNALNYISEVVDKMDLHRVLNKSIGLTDEEIIECDMGWVIDNEQN